MNKKLWVGAYLVSLLIVLAAMLVESILGILLFDEIVRPQSVFVGMVALGVIAYLQFVLVHTIVTLSALYKIWDAIQDGVTPVTPGKAIGLLFVPFYNLYWIFRVWSGYSKDHNDFIDRNRLQAPKLSETVFTVFPILVLLTAFLILPILVLPFVTLILIARACDTVNNLSIAKSAAAEGKPLEPASFIGTPQNPRSRMPLYAFIGSALIVGVLLLGFGAFSWFKLNPKPSEEEVPSKVADYVLQAGGNTTGSFLGRRKRFWNRVYVAETGGAKNAVEYNVDIFSDNSEPAKWIESMCSSTPGGAIKNASGNEVGKFCSSSGALFMQINNKTMRIRPMDSYELTKFQAKAATMDQVLAFTKALPLTAGLVFPEMQVASSPTSTSTTSTKNETSLSTETKADFTMTGTEFYESTNGKDKATLSKYEGKVLQITARQYSTTSTSAMLQAGKDTFFANFEPAAAAPFEQAKKDDRLVIKCAGRATITLNLDRCIVIENKKTVTAEDTAEVTFTAQQYWDAVASYDLPSSTRSKKWDELRGKIVRLTGKFKNATGETANLAVDGTHSIPCKLDPENVGMLSGITEGQNVSMLSVHGVTSPEHCIVVSK